MEVYGRGTASIPVDECRPTAGTVTATADVADGGGAGGRVCVGPAAGDVTDDAII